MTVFKNLAFPLNGASDEAVQTDHAPWWLDTRRGAMAQPHWVACPFSYARGRDRPRTPRPACPDTHLCSAVASSSRIGTTQMNCNLNKRLEPSYDV